MVQFLADVFLAAFWCILCHFFLLMASSRELLPQVKSAEVRCFLRIWGWTQLNTICVATRLDYPLKHVERPAFWCLLVAFFMDYCSSLLVVLGHLGYPRTWWFASDWCLASYAPFFRMTNLILLGRITSFVYYLGLATTNRFWWWILFAFPSCSGCLPQTMPWW